ncbi:MAG: AAA family ATPase, partial [Planctomycetota bacterium]
MSSVNSPSSADSFQVPPFPPFPATQRYVAVGSQEEAFSRVRTAIDAFEAISLVIGPPGTGKTLIASMLGKHFGDRRQVVTLGETSIGSSVALMRYLNHQLTKPHDAPSMDFPTEDALQLAVIAALTAGGVSHPGWLLLIDEAQTLAPEVLDTIRMLTNVMVNDRPAVSAVLFGGPKLDETLALPSLESLVQRVATRCYLHAFSPDETIQYVHRVIRACGSNPADTIDESTVRMLHRACGGVPRLINQLMTASIDAAAASGQSLIDGNVIDRAWAMLQQLPGPVVDEPAMSQPSSVEFGPLTDFDPQSTSDSSHDDRSGGLVADSGLIESDPYNEDLQCEPVNSVGDVAMNDDGTPDVEATPADE